MNDNGDIKDDDIDIVRRIWVQSVIVEDTHASECDATKRSRSVMLILLMYSFSHSLSQSHSVVGSD